MAAEVDGIRTDDASCAKEKNAPIEVERKFVFTEETEQKIINLGGLLLKHKTFHDQYYDTEDYRLTLADYWLRQRDNQWQLKCPPAKRESDPTAAQYAEYTSEPEIVDKILEVLHTDSRDDYTNMSISNLVSKTGCQVFASFQTDRKSYSLKESTVDLDDTDFGFKVGEIEVIAASEDRIADAIIRINQLANTLGFGGSKRIPGKLHTYLKKANRGHYDKLLEANILYE